MSKNIQISAEIFSQLEERVKQTDFQTVDAYVEYILEQVLNKLKNGSSHESKGLTSKEESQVKQRLHDLGYLE